MDDRADLLGVGETAEVLVSLGVVEASSVGSSLGSSVVVGADIGDVGLELVLGGLGGFDAGVGVWVG
ncbi:MAG: hypothetical protein WB767_07420, partial [Nocardioides sp.]